MNFVSHLDLKIQNNIDGLISAIGIKKEPKFFFLTLGLSVFYLLQFFIRTKPLYFLSYIILSLILYIGINKISEVLLYLLVISIFFDVGLGGRLFLLEPQFLNMGSGWWITASTVILFPLLVLTHFLKNKKQNHNLKIRSTDLLMVLFLVWNCISFLFTSNINSLFGLIQLFETVAIYLIFRIFINKTNIKYLILIIISMILFQSTIAVNQFLNKNPIGIIIEPVSQYFFQQVDNIESFQIFRSSGTFGHANMLGAFFVAFAPFLMFFKYSSLLIFLFNLLIIFSTILTYSRISWFFLVIEFILVTAWKKSLIISKNNFVYSKKIIIPILLLFLILLVLPYLLIRIATLRNSILEFGSLGTRVKMSKEALNLISKYPIFGVGLNRSLEYYSQNPVTNIFTKQIPGAFYKLHNTFLEISTESGLVGLIVFISFIVNVIFKKSNSEIDNYTWISALIGFSGLLVLSYVNPFFHTPIFRLLIFLAAIMLV